MSPRRITDPVEAMAQRVAERVVDLVLNAVDLNAIIKRVDLNAVLEQVDMNAALARVDTDALLDLTRVPELTGWAVADGQVRLGAGVTYTRLIDELGGLLPGLAMAARTVGSPPVTRMPSKPQRSTQTAAIRASSS